MSDKKSSLENLEEQIKKLQDNVYKPEKEEVEVLVAGIEAAYIERSKS